MASRSRFGSSAATLSLFFASGAATLIYEVLWLKELGLLFGNTAHAAATTLAVFFLGMALGGWIFGRRVGAWKRPLRAYALLEWAIGASAALYFLLTPAFRFVYRGLYPVLADSTILLTLVKLLLAGGILLLPAALIGGTLPVMGQHLVRSAGELGRKGTLLYLVNTAGAAAGALLAGFVLPPALGFARSYLVAIALNAIVGGIAWKLSERWDGHRPPMLDPPRAARPARPDTQAAVPRLGIALLSFASGCLVLGMEVLWTRLFALVLHNSVYSFAVILITFLVALALGSLAAHGLGRLARPRVEHSLAFVAMLSALLVVASARAFLASTHGLGALDVRGGWDAYVAAIAALAAGSMLLPCLVAGTIYPLLLKASERSPLGPGRIFGDLAAVNAVGGIAGSLLVGFVVLPLAGLWQGIWLLSVGYLSVASGVLVMVGRGRTRLLALAGFAGLGLLLRPFTTGQPVVWLDASRGERLVDLQEGRHGSVAVVAAEGNLAIKVDNHYALGDVAATDAETRQAQIPLFLVKAPRSVFFLGMGTGITAGAALHFPIDTLVVAELIPEVVQAARSHFAPHTNGLFQDPRVRIVVDDGRHFLMATDETFDLIISDLFVPWHAGTGSLYSREHFVDCRNRLNDGGRFVLWLPCGQLTRREFDVLARTLLEVFPHVTAWRGEFFPDWPTIALVASVEEQRLEPDEIRSRLLHVMPDRPSDRLTDLDIVPYVLYAGNVGAGRKLFSAAPLNTDDRPFVEYTMPKTERRAASGEVDWLRGAAFLQVSRDLLAETPPSSDPVLSTLDAKQRDYVSAGARLYEVGVLLAEDRVEESARLYRQFLEDIPLAFFPGLEAR